MYRTIFSALAAGLLGLGLAGAVAAAPTDIAGESASASDELAIDWRHIALADVSVEYITTIESIESMTSPESSRAKNRIADAVQMHWRFFRERNELQIDNLTRQMSEHWQWADRELLHKKVSHRYKQVIEFGTDDLRMLDADTAWRSHALLLDPRLFDSFSKQRARCRLTSSDVCVEYANSNGNESWRIVMNSELGLPESIEHRIGERRELTILARVASLGAQDKANLRPLAWQNYARVEFADIGDRERDPEVASAIAHLGGPALLH